MNATDYKVQVLTERMQELEQRVEELEEALAQPAQAETGETLRGNNDYTVICDETNNP